ncbi:MAG: argininosuccinate lyase, partial [Verrucomicrobiota bacterium]|nr:argininosuccinate lyase [Verrucomicrobiota bacterium]
DKEPLFDSIETVTLALEVNAEMIAAMEINEKRCRQAAGDPVLLATDLADYLVRKGIPFREAHEIVGKAVATAEKQDTPLDHLDLPAISEAFGTDAGEVFDLETALRSRTNPGAPSIENVRGEIDRWQAHLS